MWDGVFRSSGVVHVGLLHAQWRENVIIRLSKDVQMSEMEARNFMLGQDIVVCSIELSMCR